MTAALRCEGHQLGWQEGETGEVEDALRRGRRAAILDGGLIWRTDGLVD